MTNYEKIKQMSPEELANSILSSCHWCVYTIDPAIGCEYKCYEGKLNWLKQEVKE